MSTLTVWKFNTADGADNALAKLQGLQKQQIIEILDAAVVSWPQGRKRPKTYQAFNTVGVGALLFILTGQVTLDKVEAEFSPEEKGELLQSNLSAEQEVKLREDFGAEI